MLMLTVKMGQSIVIENGDELIEVVFHKKHGSGVTLGINAPESVNVWRESIFNKIKSETKDRLK